MEHLAYLARTDPEIYQAILQDEERQRTHINLIASENYASRAVLEAQGSVLQNKYAEGYPGKRYYGGCEFVDVAERLAIERLLALFGAEHANVQPHSGTQANIAVYYALLKPGDRILSMNLSHGGHLSHGAPVNMVGNYFQVAYYGVKRETGRIDFDQVAALAREHRPKLIIAGYSAYPRIIEWERFREIADEVGAYFMADIAHIAGLIVGGVHPSPVPYAHVVTSTTHKTLRGPRSAFILCKAELAPLIDKAVFPGTQGGPMMHTIAAKAVCFLEASTPEFKEYARRIVENAQALAEELMRRGYQLVSGGTDNHLMLVDLRNKGLTGKQAEAALGSVGIIVNKNMVPFDDQKPMITSGIRIGTPAVTTRGMGVEEMRHIARMIDEVLTHLDDEGVRERVRQEVRELTAHYPIYAEPVTVRT